MNYFSRKLKALIKVFFAFVILCYVTSCATIYHKHFKVDGEFKASVSDKVCADSMLGGQYRSNEILFGSRNYIEITEANFKVGFCSNYYDRNTLQILLIPTFFIEPIVKHFKAEASPKYAYIKILNLDSKVTMNINANFLNDDSGAVVNDIVFLDSFGPWMDKEGISRDVNQTIEPNKQLWFRVPLILNKFNITIYINNQPYKFQFIKAGSIKNEYFET